MLADKRAVLQVLGCLICKPSLLDEYRLDTSDFEAESFYQIVFSAVYNIYAQGANRIDCFTIDSYLSAYEKQYKIFETNKGLEYCENAIELAEIENFDYWYWRLRKFSLLRFYQNRGISIKSIYDDSVIDPELMEQETKRLDHLTIDDIIETMEQYAVIDARMLYASDGGNRGQLAGKGMKALKSRLKETPDFGLPLQSPLMTTISRGARLGKLYLRSASSGGGKTRTALADLCTMSVPWFYDDKQGKWVYTGLAEPSLFISTELQEDELQTIIMAFVSGVPEDHIMDGEYLPGEEERVDQAIEYIESAPLYIEIINNFSIQDIVNIIKTYHREKGCLYFVFDYIHTSVKLIAEIAGIGNGMKVREDQMLFLFIDTLKNLCVKMNIFILTMTQLNGTYKDSPIKDETMLRGAKSMADRIDLGEISLPPTAAELEAIRKVMKKGMIGVPEPTLVRHVYKVRRGKITRIRVWQKANLGTGRTEDLFVTTNDYKLIPVEATKIEYIDQVIEEHSVDAADIAPEETEKSVTVFDW